MVKKRMDEATKKRVRAGRLLQEGKTPAEKASRHKIKTRNTDPRSRCRNRRSRSPEYAAPLGHVLIVLFLPDIAWLLHARDDLHLLQFLPR